MLRLALGIVRDGVEHLDARDTGAIAGLHFPGVLAAALSLSATGALMVLFGVSHPPAGATTLIVSPGIIAPPKDLVIIEVAFVPLTAQSLLINRVAELPYPLWRRRKFETIVSQSKA